ncbi:MAG TPA: MATE family efflux transporter [Anaerolineae bacterium]|nr:MATE family efflux transporter [Anaerolineae bacterium]
MGRLADGALLRTVAEVVAQLRRAGLHDLTHGDLGGSIARLTWPNLASQLLFMAPTLYDAVWLGRIGAGAQAAAGLAISVRITMISVLMGLSGASGAVVARYVGAKDQQNANLATLQSVILMLVSSSTLGVIGVIFAEPLMRLGGADAETLPLAVRYARILFGGLIAMEMVPSVGGMLSGIGAPQVWLEMTAWVTGVMLIAEPLLVTWLGLEGAVLALTGAHAVAMVWGLRQLVVGRAPVRIDLHDLRLDFPMMQRVLRIAAPTIIQRGTPNLAMTLLTRFIAVYGAAALAAWTVVQRVFGFAQVPGMALSRVSPAIVGQNLGARQPERAERGVNLVMWITLIVTGIVLGALVIFAPHVFALFSDDAEATAIGVQMLRVLSLGYLANTLTLVLNGAQIGAGDTVAPMLINIVALWVIQIPLVFLFSQVLRLGVTSIWVALVIGWLAQLGLLMYRQRQGVWKLKQV